ncbi:MAG: thioredoxin [Lachnospiraceae bacterium]|jgi:thioredoxin 1|nr:thioredoxin [Lachnospiraceae bacterium]MBQ6364170.1 thioredoxin [Lachnospiraceae bacterium]MBR2995224.1 thioredoxin [Lachnospiraceae bacterium]
MIQTVVNNDLSEAKSAAAAVVDFNATWCGPCKMLGPVLEKLSGEMADKASFYGVDVDENSDLAEEFGVMSIPTLVILKNGEKVAERLGFAPEPILKSWLESNL